MRRFRPGDRHVQDNSPRTSRTPASLGRGGAEIQGSSARRSTRAGSILGSRRVQPHLPPLEPCRIIARRLAGPRADRSALDANGPPAKVASSWPVRLDGSSRASYRLGRPADAFNPTYWLDPPNKVYGIRSSNKHRSSRLTENSPRPSDSWPGLACCGCEKDGGRYRVYSTLSGTAARHSSPCPQDGRG